MGISRVWCETKPGCGRSGAVSQSGLPGNSRRDQVVRFICEGDRNEKSNDWSAPRLVTEFSIAWACGDLFQPRFQRLSRILSCVARPNFKLMKSKTSGSHLKVISHSAAAAPLLKASGIKMDEGVMPTDDKGALREFLGKARKGRIWAREPSFARPVEECDWIYSLSNKTVAES